MEQLIYLLVRVGRVVYIENASFHQNVHSLSFLLYIQKLLVENDMLHLIQYFHFL